MQQEMYNEAISHLKQIYEQMKSADNTILLRSYFLNTEIVFSLYRMRGLSKEVRLIFVSYCIVVT